jgi:hypothetical protein
MSTYINAAKIAKTIFCVVPQHKGSVYFPPFRRCRQERRQAPVKLSFYKALTLRHAGVRYEWPTRREIRFAGCLSSGMHG